MNAVVAEAETAGAHSSPATPALLTYAGPVLLDFDETIYLRNSTEDFIDSARPAVLAFLALCILDAIRPWRWTGGECTRDVWRVRVILTLFPWTKGIWAKRVAVLAIEFANTELIAAIQKRSSTPNCQAVVVTTSGFDAVVIPLATALGLSGIRIVAARVTTFSDRRVGKMRMVVSRLGNEAVRRALVVTNSKHNDPLLEACALPIRIDCAETTSQSAFSSQYLPGLYLTSVKHPNESYFSRTIMQEDFALWVLASIALANQPFLHAIALWFLLISFLSIYEAGCVEIDRIENQLAEDKEANATIRETSIRRRIVLPWSWALLSGAIGVLLLRGFSTAGVTSLIAWTATLVSTYGVFALYRRLDDDAQIWWDLVLQFLRGAAFVVLVPIHLIGAIAIGAQVTGRWIDAYTNHHASQPTPDRSSALRRLLLFILSLTLLALAEGPSAIVNWSASALLAWNVFLARRELLSVILGAMHLEKNHSERERHPSLRKTSRTPP